jgi:hypothetical protein
MIQIIEEIRLTDILGDYNRPQYVLLMIFIIHCNIISLSLSYNGFDNGHGIMLDYEDWNAIMEKNVNQKVVDYMNCIKLLTYLFC